MQTEWDDTPWGGTVVQTRALVPATSMPPAPPEAPAKAVTGPGAFAMTYDAPVSSTRYDTSRGMAKAQALSHSNPWIDRAERLISGRAAGLPWHLETPDDETVDDESSPELRALLQLLERPNERMTWRELSKMTYRHMGVINVAAWYLDALNGIGVPQSILYINPVRLTPSWRSDGTLRGWILDAESEYAWGRGTPLELDEIVLFVLDPPDTGIFGCGLVEAAEAKAALNKVTDRFLTQTYGSGGRRGSWIMPREGRLPDDVFDALKANVRDVRESFDSAKRDIVTKAPLDITPQASTPQELQATEVSAMTRDDILVLWGIDVTDAGVPGSGGLASGELRKAARQSTYENAVEPRVDVFQETVQLKLIDRWKAGGIALEFVIERPEFEDDTPAFTRAATAASMPLRNWERREIIGLDPFGDAVLDNAVWLPAGISEAYIAPDENGRIPEVAQPEPVVTAVVPPQLQSGEAPVENLPAKASPLGRTRTTVDRRVVPAMRKSVASVLAEQKAEVLRLIREKAAHLMSRPGDAKAIWNEKAWDAAMHKAIASHAEAVSGVVTVEAKQALGHLNPAKADPSFAEDVLRFVLKRGGERVAEINRFTRDAVVDAIREVLSGLKFGEGETPSIPDLSAALTEKVGGLTVWDEARAERIARTETMFAYNDAALGSYREYGITEVEATDGDDDEECRDRVANNPYTLEEALAITDHPNGTLDWIPVI